jgi:hypothetical protein
VVEPMESPTSETLEDKQALTKLQEIMEKFSSDIAESVRNVIFTKTAEGEELVNKDSEEENKEVQNIIDDINNTNTESTIDVDELLITLEKMILEEETQLHELESNQGVGIEILNEQEKVRSLVNKYIQ